MYLPAVESGSLKYDKKATELDSDRNSNLLGHCNGGDVVSDYMEILYPQEMKAKLLCNGEVVDEYKIEQCDKCSQLRRFDKFGYQKGYDSTDNIIWFCGDCR